MVFLFYCRWYFFKHLLFLSSPQIDFLNFRPHRDNSKMKQLFDRYFEPDTSHWLLAGADAWRLPARMGGGAMGWFVVVPWGGLWWCHGAARVGVGLLRLAALTGALGCCLLGHVTLVTACWPARTHPVPNTTCPALRCCRRDRREPVQGGGQAEGLLLQRPQPDRAGGWVGLYGPRWGAWVLGARWGGLFWGRGLGL